MQTARRYEQYPHEFSGGMRQRVMIAMALACNPKVIIADEPTTALDVTIQAQILDLLRNLKNKINSSIMLITHDLGVIAEMADYVVVMYAGRVVEKGYGTGDFCKSFPPLHNRSDGFQTGNRQKWSISFILFPARCRTRSTCRITAISVTAAKCAVRNVMENYPCEISLSETHKVSCYRYYDKKEGKLNAANR